MLTGDSVSAPARRILSSIHFGPRSKVVIALSGGGDSTALACLARDHFAALGEVDRLLAVTVDHGLRPEAALEAEAASAFCAALGIAHETRRWSGDKPATGLQAAAREARYRELAGAAADAGGAIVLTGHTLDDQAETVAMRAARGAGRGLSGIAPATLYERRTWFVRPLLGRRRDELRTWLQARGQGWIDDPSNRDERFERVRLRHAAAGAPVDPAIYRDGLEARRAQAEAAAVILRDEAAWRFDANERTAAFEPAHAVHRDGFALSLAVAMSWVGHGAYLPPVPVLDKAVRFVAAAAPGARMTAAGCLMQRARDEVRIGREARNRRSRGHGFDHLLASPDFAVAAALAGRTGQTAPPPPPLSGYPD